MSPEASVVVVGRGVDWRRWKGWNHNGYEAGTATTQGGISEVLNMVSCVLDNGNPCSRG